MITRESNTQFLDRHRLPDPVRRLQTSIAHCSDNDAHLGPELQPSADLLSWREIVRGQLTDPDASKWSQLPPNPGSSLLYLGDASQPSFDCDICGQSFYTQASLKSHVYRMHLDHQLRTERSAEVKQARNIPSMEHARDGLPQCRHCLHSFTTWHAFFYHTQAQSCAGLRSLMQQASADQTLIHSLSEALIDNPEVLNAAKNSSWQDLAELECVRAKHNYCIECHHWSAKPQYVRRHMLAMHPEQADLIQQCVTDIQKSKVSVSNPCNFCGQAYTRKDAHLRSCVGIFSGVYLHRRLARGRPLGLAGDSKASLGVQVAENVRRVRVPDGGHGPSRAEGSHAGPQHAQSTPPATGDADARSGRGAGDGPFAGAQPQAEVAQVSPQGPRKTRRQRRQTGAEPTLLQFLVQRGDGAKHQRLQVATETYEGHPGHGCLEKQLAEMKSTLGMPTTLVIRQEIQQGISKQDTSFVLFLDTRGPHNLATSLYKMGETWHATKRDHPDRLTAPTRVILFQHLLEAVLNKFKAMTETPSARSTAQNLGLLLKNGTAVPALKWDQTTRQHIQDTSLEPMETKDVKDALEELIVLSTKFLVITRFHGMRKLTEEYASQTLGMFLEIGVRTPEAHAAWNHLHRLQQSAAWQAAGVFLRHERLHMSSLANEWRHFQK